VALGRAGDGRWLDDASSPTSGDVLLEPISIATPDDVGGCGGGVFWPALKDDEVDNRLAGVSLSSDSPADLLNRLLHSSTAFVSDNMSMFSLGANWPNDVGNNGGGRDPFANGK